VTVDQARVALRPWHRQVPIGVVLGLIFCVGILPVALDLAQPHGLYGLTEYDDGVYFAAAQRLIAGVFPYKDFVLVQPPGITVVLSPFAALSHLVGGRHALGAARIFTAIVAGANAALVGYLLRRRGLLAMAIGGLALAVFPTAYTAGHTFLLEPYCVLFCLIGACFVFASDEIASSRRCLVGGLFFGLAGSVKVFAIAPILVIFAILAFSYRKEAIRFAEGISVSLAVFVLPFLIMAPSGFIHDVISTQLNRSTQTPTPFLNRLFAVTGLAYASPGLEAVSLNGPIPSLPAGAGPTWAASGGIAGVIAILAVRLGWRSERRPFAWFIVASAILGVAICLIPSVYYDHYAYFSAPFLALALGAGVGLAARGVRTTAKRLALTRQGAVWQILTVGTIALICAGVVGADLPSTASQKTIMDKFGDVGPAIAAMVPPGACTISDAESLLVSAGRSDIGPPGCPAIVDTTGMWLSIDPLHPVSVRTGIAYADDPTYKDPKLVAIWRSAFEVADYVVLSGVCATRIPWTPPLSRYFDTHYTQMSGPYGNVFRRGPPTTLAEHPTIRFSCAATKTATTDKAAAIRSGR